MHLGLPVDGNMMCGMADGDWQSMCIDYLGAAPPEFNGGRIALSWLKANFEVLNENASEDQAKACARAYILRIIGGILMPDKSRNQVHCMWLRHLIDFDEAGRYSWGAAVLAFLFREMCRATNYKKTANYYGKYKKNDERQLVVRMCYELLPQRFESMLQELFGKNKKGCEYIMDISKEMWTNAYDGGTHADVPFNDSVLGPTSTSSLSSPLKFIVFLKIVNGPGDYVLEDVPHLSDYIHDLPTYPNPLQDNPAYSVVKQYFVHVDDSVPQKVVVYNDGPIGIHFRRAGARQKLCVNFQPDDVHACIVTCGGLCPGLNTVVREIVCGLHHMYGVKKVLWIDGGFKGFYAKNTELDLKGGYRGFYAKNTVYLNPKVVNDIHKRGGTVLGTSPGGHDTIKIVDSIQDRGINQVYIIGGDGTQRGAALIFEEIRRRGLKVSVAGIPKTIDNDIPVIDKSFGFDTAVEEAQRAINAAHVEAESSDNCIGLVKVMGRYSGFIAMHATLANRDVDCCLIPESPFYFEGSGGLFEYIEKRLKENGHIVIVIAEGAGQELLSESIQSMTDASGNKLLQDVGLWLSDAGGSETDDAELSDCTLMALRYHELADQRKGGN
ncbi:ATP-dependent 6-phosphofructokinase 3 [Hibiscus syriacus]|uniref:ATP-dependent 6-phosphofructokinase 3 n=1 Tax=Hibiscus syriacus TaxID=106335 RepID=A0A6A2YG90_HIBSY|nr:ATP-dependent 6-phosphofructokinase 3 [Hibiscus syriacus]